jgi:hypothetical protein
MHLQGGLVEKAQDPVKMAAAIEKDRRQALVISDAIARYHRTYFRDYLPPVDGQVYELIDPIHAPHPETGTRLTFTHALSHGTDITGGGRYRFDLLLDADQPQRPDEFELRYDLPLVRYGIMWEYFEVHQHVKLERRPHELQGLADALNTTLADKARREKRERG